MPQYFLCWKPLLCDITKKEKRFPIKFCLCKLKFSGSESDNNEFRFRRSVGRFTE
jgi:hypothetical protein